jgi:hypothetical protein
MTRRWLALSSCALALVLLAGCGGDKASIEGTVTFDGAPVDGGAITFLPEGDSKEAARGGAQITDGKYTVNSATGLPAGKYKVEIVWKKKTGKQIPNTSDPGTTVDETKQVLPMKYNSKTELTVEIKSGSNRGVNFDLKSGGPVDSNFTGGTPPPRQKAVGD